VINYFATVTFSFFFFFFLKTLFLQQNIAVLATQ